MNRSARPNSRAAGLAATHSFDRNAFDGFESSFASTVAFGLRERSPSALSATSSCHTRHRETARASLAAAVLSIASDASPDVARRLFPVSATSKLSMSTRGLDFARSLSGLSLPTKLPDSLKSRSTKRSVKSAPSTEVMDATGGFAIGVARPVVLPLTFSPKGGTTTAQGPSFAQPPSCLFGTVGGGELRHPHPRHPSPAEARSRSRPVL